MTLDALAFMPPMPLLEPIPAAAAAGSGDETRRSPEAIRRAAESFEALFLAEMLRPVFEGVDSEGWFGGGPGEKIYRSMMVKEYGKTIARSGGLGIADAVEREILKLQEMDP